MRVWAAQAWPLLTKEVCRSALHRGRPMSASSRMTAADLPPSSRLTRLSDPPQLAPMSRPAVVDPVKAILSTPGWSTSARPASSPPVRMDTVPGGRSAASTISASSMASSEASGAALTTTVHPASRAGVSLVAISTWGTFQATMAPTTPTGSRRTTKSR